MSPAIEDRNPGQAANVVEPPGSIYSEKSIITLRKEQKLEGPGVVGEPTDWRDAPEIETR